MLALTAADGLTVLLTILTLVVLEALLSADNALVLAVMVRHLPRPLQTKALRYGMAGAFAFRLIGVVFAGYLLEFWHFKVLGGCYLLYLAIKGLLHGDEAGAGGGDEGGGKGFWATVVGVELADIAFSLDSILAAVALAEGMPHRFAELYVGPFSVKLWTIYLGGVAGIVAMRFVAGFFLRLLERFPALARVAYILVSWIGLKLIGSGLHVAAGWPLEMPEWLFWTGMGTFLLYGLARPPAAAPAPAE